MVGSGLPAQVPQFFPMLGEFLGTSFGAGLYCLFYLGVYKQFVKKTWAPILVHKSLLDSGCGHSRMTIKSGYLAFSMSTDLRSVHKYWSIPLAPLAPRTVLVTFCFGVVLEWNVVLWYPPENSEFPHYL